MTTQDEAAHYSALLNALEPVEGWVRRIGSGSVPEGPQPRSPMHGDDDRLRPYHLSHSAWHSLSHAVDHLNCLRAVVEAG